MTEFDKLVAQARAQARVSATHTMSTHEPGVSFEIKSDLVNKYLVNQLAGRGRTRPHPWTTRHDYISWSGLTDRTFNARLLPAAPYPEHEAAGTRKPPIADVAKLFAAPASGQRLCPKSTCLFPAFAQYLTDGFIRTQLSNDEAKIDRRKTTSNHEIDLSPLYGRTERQTTALRAPPGLDGKGRLKSQRVRGEEFPPYLHNRDGTIKAEFLDVGGSPILDPPLALDRSPARTSLFAVGGDRVNATPFTAMMGTLFLREHNRLAGLIERANPNFDDERVFQTARNIIIVMFIRIVVEEYINHINTSSLVSFVCDPSIAWTANWNRPNWMTAEFSLLYRWHSLVPERVKWGAETISGAALLLDNSRLVDKGLADAFVTASANAATELGLGNTATFVTQNELKAVEQARIVNLDGYNAYRRAMKLAPAESFIDVVQMSDDPTENERRKELAADLQRLYGSVDNLEFYVGLFAEPRGAGGPLPELIMFMVAMDAFSQALTNPLLSLQRLGRCGQQAACVHKHRNRRVRGHDLSRGLAEAKWLGHRRTLRWNAQARLERSIATMSVDANSPRRRRPSSSGLGVTAFAASSEGWRCCSRGAGRR